VATELRPPPAGSWWWCRIPGTDGRPTRLVEVESDRYPDGAHVELSEAAARIQIGADAICTADLAEDGSVQRLEVAPRFAPKAPPVWFVEVRESRAEPPAVSLVAFTGAGVAAGMLLDESAVSNVSARSDDQLGALRWYPATGETDQIYVQPQWRRRNIAAALLAAGELLSVARGWPRFWADGQRTELGEQARNGRSWRQRTAELTVLHPPMTPGA
jgi:GNAT superfamily N-acetyltransferase